MMLARRSSTFMFALALAVLPLREAGAAASDWHRVEGGSIRIVTDGAPDADGMLRGALEIKLAPGWKTYWRDPGDSGVPPTLDILSGNDRAAVEIDFPAPMRFDDGYALWAGYDGSVALALNVRLPETAQMPARMKANVFLGVCETICVPVQAQLEVPATTANIAEHEKVVAAAFAALPGPARPGFAARVTQVADDAILIEAEIPDGAEPRDLFVAGPHSLRLGTPQLVAGADTPTFSVPLVSSAGESATTGEIHYTLVTSAGAVSGRLVLP